MIDWGKQPLSSSQPIPPLDPMGAVDPVGLWTLDPIDGTLGYLRQQQYSICLAKFTPDHQDISFSLLHCPNYQQILPQQSSALYVAIKDKGSFLVIFSCSVLLAVSLYFSPNY